MAYKASSVQVLVHWACAKISTSAQQPDGHLKGVLVCADMKQQGHML